MPQHKQRTALKTHPPNEPYRILIVNTHSVLNSGDAGIVSAQIQWLKRERADVKITLTSRTPETDSAFYHTLGADVIAPPTPSPSLYDNVAVKFTKCITHFLNPAKQLVFLKNVRRSDLIISSGGGYFWSHRSIFPGMMFFQNIVPLLTARLFRKRIIMFPQSFGPIFNRFGRFLLKIALQAPSMEKIFIRENRSMDFLNSLKLKEHTREKIEICPDMAFLLEAPESPSKDNVHRNAHRPCLAVSVRSWNPPKPKHAHNKHFRQSDNLESIERICVGFVETHGGELLVFPQSRGPGQFENDRIPARKLMDRLQKKLPSDRLHYINLEETAPPADVIQIISRADCVLTVRFHSAIFALIQGIPILAVAYQPKSPGIMQQFNLESFCFDINNLESTEAEKRLEEIISNREDLEKMIIKQLQAIRREINHRLHGSRIF